MFDLRILRHYLRGTDSDMTNRKITWVKSLVFTATLLSCTASFGLTETTLRDENFGMGKLEIRSQAIGQSMRLTVPFLIPGDITKGWRTYLGTTWTNVWANDEEFLLDYEMLDTFLAVGYGLNDDVGLALVIDNRSYFGGAMDGFIEGFHDLFGVSQDGRDTSPNGRAIIQRTDPATGDVTAEISASELNNTGASFMLNYNFDFGLRGMPSVNLYGVARYPLESPKIFSNNNELDYGLGMGLSKRWVEHWYTYAMLNYTIYADRGTTVPGGVEFENTQWTGMFAVAWQYHPDLSIIAQYLYSSAAIKTLKALDEAAHEVHLGFKWRLADKYMLDFAIIENIITMDNSPDFGLHLGLSLDL